MDLETDGYGNERSNRDRGRGRGARRGHHQNRGESQGRNTNRDNGRAGRGRARRSFSTDPRGQQNNDDQMRQRRGGRGRPESGKHWKQVFGFTRLTEYQSFEASDLVLKLVGEPDLLKDVLECTDHSDEMVGLLLTCLSKACSYTILKQHVQQILVTLQSSAFFKQTILHFILKLMAASSAEIEKYGTSLKCIIIIIREMKSRMPSTMFEVIGITSLLEKVVSRLKACMTPQSVEIVELFKRLEVSNEEEMKQMSNEKEQSFKRRTVPDEEYQDPPEDFRQIPVFPEEHDILINTNPFLRMNKRTGGYKDLNHYLDVQFRLLREDFIGPLREGIQQYVGFLKTPKGHDKKNKMPKDIRVYTDVQVISSICNNGGLCRRISFTCSGFKRIRWESSKRLLFGSLVCLSNDDFDTLHFATVGNRDHKDLRKGIVDIQFCNDSMVMACLPDDTIFKMAESSAFFEAYRHVLSGMQTLANGDLPFEKYIVRCKSDVDAPAYLRRNPFARFDLRPLVDDDVVLYEKRFGDTYSFSPDSAQARVPVLLPNQWPSPEILRLNESQFLAVQMALSKEFVIIQGPPGTGKTYIGKKIVKALLHNKDIWSPSTAENKPLLVVCYTNHALDQFLEGICQFYKGEILRLGSRSSSDEMKRHNINTKRQEIRRNRRAPLALHRERVKAKVKMNTLKTQINAISERIEKAKRDILHEDTLQQFIGMRMFDQLKQMLTLLIEQMKLHGFFPKRDFEKSAILEWLGYGDLTGGEQTLHFPTTTSIKSGFMVYDKDKSDDSDEDSDDYIEAEDEANREMQKRVLDIDEENNDDINKEAAMLEITKRFQALGLQNDKVALNVSTFGSKHSYKAGDWQIDAKQRKRMKKTIRQELVSADRMTRRELDRIPNIWNIPQKDRWRLYRSWTFLYCQYLQEQIRDSENEFQEACDLVKEIQLHEDKDIMQRSTVIGMTTTCAARYQSVLKEIGPKIVVVEEAAEVLEAHILTTLSKKCEHLILIGDHQQLKPSPTVYKLAKQYNLDLSLFERLIDNKMEYRCLTSQHRMRPEISQIMTLIYPNLEDHSSVKNYESIKGVASNVFLIDHREEESSDEDLVSHSNIHEAEFLVAFCRYLLLQGYTTSQITILTLYSAQLFELKKRMPKKDFDGLRLTVVDNYQGEENDIILLSLVRSNTKRISGFVSIENRICVAFSRAKKGLYVIGNFKMLERAKDKKSDLWGKIVSLAKEEQIIGPSLLLKCQNHPKDRGINATTAEDFRKAPEGGCLKPCEARLSCGHACKRACHVYDKKHIEYICTQPCTRRVCEVEGHKCTRTCGKPCSKCMIKIQKVVPGCNHTDNVPCSQDPSTWACTLQCSKILSCGHPCQNRCCEPHTMDCQITVKKAFQCGHIVRVKCSDKMTGICSQPCASMLECGHPCSGTCGECFSGKLHRPCRTQCKRTLVCEHVCKDFCSNCPPCSTPCQKRCVHSICQKYCGEMCIPCMEPCEWRCIHYSCNKQCYKPCQRPRCNNPCRKKLKCGHNCIGLCGELCPPLCRICDKEKVTEIFFGTEDADDARFVQLQDCAHFFEVDGLDQWMDQPVERDGEKISIKLKECPRCKTPIRRNLRYGNMIKEALNDIEKVKKQIRGRTNNISTIKLSIEYEMQKLGAEDSRVIKEDYKKKNECELTSCQNFESFKNQIVFLQKIEIIKSRLTQTASRMTASKLLRMADRAIRNLQYFTIQERSTLTNQETNDILEEIDRLTFMLQYVELEKNCERLKLDGRKAELYKTTQEYLIMDTRLSDGKKLLIKHFLKSTEGLVTRTGLGITDEEKKDILKAMDLSKGHWYKCPNGHVYAIGDCGGATVESLCPECKAKIGGSSHRLREDNALASEMDGATHSAWSEQAHMGNYDPFEIRF